ncbi:flagellar operon protein (TIGR03826 family) [Lederbergia galactosidilyticus]|uniref:TIGR03826 family flagellar region protein n=1 Tax=Lederbergia galactosidilytica TaxID=217031 RepID=UPI001AE93106|nr:TIGR03826 family flagellar region protein [Lederbergia galactosidilytica]MBP1913367.1 flagellar operon protein (TIGR03826 family) [Lederbergia galactosidilytica]
MDLLNCPTCGKIYVNHFMRDVCNECYQKEETAYDEVYRFLRKRENRAATIETIAEVTGVEVELLYKWLRKGRLHAAQFPNLGYPCDRCGKLIKEGKLCDSCSTGLKEELTQFEKEKERHEELSKVVYYSQDQRKK